MFRPLVSGADGFNGTVVVRVVESRAPATLPPGYTETGVTAGFGGIRGSVGARSVGNRGWFRRSVGSLTRAPGSPIWCAADPGDAYFNGTVVDALRNPIRSGLTVEKFWRWVNRTAMAPDHPRQYVRRRAYKVFDGFLVHSRALADSRWARSALALTSPETFRGTGAHP